MSLRSTLTQRDHAILSGLAKQNGLVSAAYYQQLTDKILSALIIDLDAVEPELATLGSFVRYRVNGGRALEHKLVLQPDRGKEQHALSIKTRRGLGLLGMRQEETITLVSPTQESPEVLELEMVLFQPEADGAFMRPSDCGLARTSNYREIFNSSAQPIVSLRITSPPKGWGRSDPPDSHLL